MKAGRVCTLPIFHLLLAVTMVALSGCSAVPSPEQTASPNVPPRNPGSPSDPGSPAVAQISAVPEEISPGENSLLKWTTQNASSVKIDPDVGAVASAGEKTVSPKATTTYTITAQGQAGPTTAQATIKVKFSGVFTYKYNTARDGLNDGETILTPSNVKTPQFGKLFSYPVDGLVYAQPLYVRGLNIPGKGVHNVLYVATEHDSVYAFDADGNPTQPLWKRSFLNPDAGITSVPNVNVNDSGGRTALGAEVGITGTPVIDVDSNTLYLSAMTWENGVAVHRLHALNLATGEDKFNVPAKIEASVEGTGIGNDGKGKIPFLALRQNQRAGLLLLNGLVYVAFGSFSDHQPYHGWLFAFDAQTLERRAVMNFSPKSEGAAIWQSGAAPAADENGNIYLATGDGLVTTPGGPDWGDALMKLKLSGDDFDVLNWFSPFNQACLDLNDLDLGSGGPMLLPDGISPDRLLVLGSKEGRLYLLDRDNLGKYQAGADSQIPQWILINPVACNIQDATLTSPQLASTRRTYGTPAYWNRNVYIGPANSTLRAYHFADGQLSLASESKNRFQIRGPVPTVSSSGLSNAIVWVADHETESHLTVLRAYDATDLSRELYNSAAIPNHGIGRGVNFAVPVVVNGKVYVGAENRVTVFGLRN